MGTWHQDKSCHTPLWHTTKWTVVEDPPDGTRCVSRWDTAEQASAHSAKIPHSYVLPPQKEVNR